MPFGHVIANIIHKRNVICINILINILLFKCLAPEACGFSLWFASIFPLDDSETDFNISLKMLSRNWEVKERGRTS